MAQVRRIIDNVLLDVPFALTHQGLSGTVVIDDFGEGDKIYFTYGISTDDVSDTNEVTTHVSMGSFYSLDLTESDPEGVDPDDPEPPVLEPTRIPVFLTNDATYKTYITSGTYQFETRINLFIENNPEDFEVEFSGYFHGSLSGVPGSQSPLTWVTVPRENDNSYYIILPSNDDMPDPTPQPIWARFVGNTGQKFGNYVTFRTNGDDPNDVIPPDGDDGGVGTEPAVDGSIRGFDLVWTVWGGFSGKDLTRPDDRPSSKTYYAEQSAMSGSGRDDYKDQAPFYARHVAPQTIGVPIGVVGYPFHVDEPRYADIEWQMTRNDFKMCNEYLIRSGFQCWNFTYYANGYQLSQMRQFFEDLTEEERREVTAFYSMHQIGGSRDEYRDGNGQIDLTNEYTINLNHIVEKMHEDWYKKIGGKPVIVYFDEAESNMQKDAYNLREAYRARWGVSDTFPFYEIQMSFLADTNNGFVNSMGMQARTWYYQTNGESQGTHSLESILSDGYTNFVNMGNSNTSKDVVPSMTIALDGRARWEYPLDYASIDNVTSGTPSAGSGINWAGYNPPNGLAYIDKSYSYYNAATSGDITSVANKFSALKSTFGSRMKLAFVSTFDELSEGGLSCGMPSLNLDGESINDDVIEWFRNIYNDSYVTPTP